MCILKYFEYILWCYGMFLRRYKCGHHFAATVLFLGFRTGFTGWKGKELKPLVDGEAIQGWWEGTALDIGTLLGRPMRGSIFYLMLAVYTRFFYRSLQWNHHLKHSNRFTCPRALRSSWLAMGYADQCGRVLHVPGYRSAFLSCPGGGGRVQKHVPKAKPCSGFFFNMLWKASKPRDFQILNSFKNFLSSTRCLYKRIVHFRFWSHFGASHVYPMFQVCTAAPAAPSPTSVASLKTDKLNFVPII